MEFNLDAKFNWHEIILIIGAYGIVQVLAQDLGIKTGKKQRDLVQSIPIQIIVLFSAAYTVVGNFRDTMIATLLYYLLKYVYSKGELSNVCFEDV
jgi:hypothetical protein